MVSLNGGRPIAETGELKSVEAQVHSLKISRILFSQFSHAVQVQANTVVHFSSLPVPFRPRNSPTRYGVS